SPGRTLFGVSIKLLAGTRFRRMTPDRAAGGSHATASATAATSLSGHLGFSVQDLAGCITESSRIDVLRAPGPHLMPRRVDRDRDARVLFPGYLMMQTRC